MPAILKNNAVSRLAASISIDDLQLSVSAGDGSKFPELSPGQWFPLTLMRADGSLEITRVTARNGDLLTVSRGQETTAPISFTAGDRVEMRVTAGLMNSKLDKEGGVVTGSLTITGDLKAYRPDAPATGAILFGNTGEKHLYWDGSSYAFAGGSLSVNGKTVWTAENFNPASYLPLTGGSITGQISITNASPTITFQDTDWGQRQLHCNSGLVGFLTSTGGWSCYSDNAGTFIASGNIGAYSDRRHKKKISTIKSGLALVESLRGVRYTDRRTGEVRVGVIAQEVHQVLPEVVGESPDGLYVDYGNITGPLIEAVKELSKKVRKLEGK